MIKLYCSQNMESNLTLNKIYEDLAEKIYNKAKDQCISILYSYNNQEKERFDSQDAIKEFLIAKDFFRYNISLENSEKSEILDIINYKWLKPENRREILDIMNIQVCPYCNMNYIINYKKSNVKKGTADIDHFYLKSKYPEYALCLYNFVPSCPVCNQRIKRKQDTTVDNSIYPHKEGFGEECCFQITNLAETIISNQKRHADIELVNKNKNAKIENSKSVFELDERYKMFYKEAEELLDKALIYNEIYAESLNRYDTSWNKENVKYMVFGPKLSEEEYGRISLGKFKQDILTQLGVFK